MPKVALIIFTLFLSGCFRTQPVENIVKNEKYYNHKYCQDIGGKTEVKHRYSYGKKSSFVKVDCETSTQVIEGGLDKRSSLDSVQQALFFAKVTHKEPVVVIYDTDNKLGKYEHRIKAACEQIGLKCIRISHH